jgi:hypothetical protein
MLSKIPLQLEKIKKEDIDKEILRAGIMASWTPSVFTSKWPRCPGRNTKNLLVSPGRKTHVNCALLLWAPEQAEELRAGERRFARNGG